MPVDRGRLRQFIGDENAHLVTLDHFDRRAWTAAVVPPKSCLHAWRHFPDYRLGNQMKILPTIFHAPWRAPTIKRDHRMIGPTAGRCRWRHHLRMRDDLR